MNILHRLRRQEQYYRLFLGGFAAMPLTSGIIKRFIRFIRNKYKSQYNKASGYLKQGSFEIAASTSFLLANVSVALTGKQLCFHTVLTEGGGDHRA
ncbi:MAG: hypothetical protein J6K89_04580 [Oscillospiraceae bacterium]|nr:hypothetical protein [Oscillospiraceae bacterium]